MFPTFRRVRSVGIGQSLLGSSGAFDERELSAAPQRRQGWFRTVFAQAHIALGFLWIAPAVTLLVLNHWGVVVGASIGCLRCRPDLDLSVESINRISRDDHNALGALQVASKAFEVWFMFVAASLVYDVTMFMAERQGHPIPIGFLTSYLEFGDLRYFCTGAPWTTPVRSGTTFGKSWRSTLKLYGFLAFVIAMSITANLMGPGSAVLILPTQQFRNVSHVDGPVFKGLTLSDQPSNTSIGPECTSSSWLSAGNYTCFADPYASTLDALLTDALAGFDQTGIGAFNIGLSSELFVTLYFNTTCVSTDCGLFSAPNRQILRTMSSDYVNYQLSYINGTLEPPLDNAIQTIFHRTGPSVVQNVTCALGNVSVATVAEDQTVRCYGLSGANLCIPFGQGWNHGNDMSSFSLGSMNDTTGDVTINNYSSEVAANLTWNAVGCSATDQSCWDSKFIAKTTPNIANVTITEFNNTKLATSDRILYCTSWFYSSTSHYSLDPSPANDINLVRVLSSSQDTNAPQKVHPDWLLAAWSVERGGTVPASVQAAQVMVSSILGAYMENTTFDDPLLDPGPTLNEFNELQELAFAQGMSLVDFATTSVDPSAKNVSPEPLTLEDWKVVYVYAYGNDSRTATMGVFVLLTGIIAALVRTGTAIVRRERTKSAFDLVAIALKHQYGGEFEGKETEAQRSRVRVGVDRLHRRGKKEFGLKFERVDGGGIGSERRGMYWGGDGSRSEQDSIALTESPQMIRGGDGQEDVWKGR